METIFSTIFAVFGILCFVVAGILLIVLAATLIKYFIKEVWNAL